MRPPERCGWYYYTHEEFWTVIEGISGLIIVGQSLGGVVIELLTFN